MPDTDPQAILDAADALAAEIHLHRDDLVAVAVLYEAVFVTLGKITGVTDYL